MDFDFLPRATPHEATHIKPIYDSLKIRARSRVWWRVPVPLPLYLGAEGNTGRDTRLSGWGMVYIPL